MRKSQTERGASSRTRRVSPAIVAAWFQTAVNPVLANLELEISLLEQHNWTWRHQRQKMEAIQEIFAYVDAYATANLEQFARFHKPLAKLMEEHDRRVEELRQACSVLQATLENVAECIDLFKVLTSECFQNLPINKWFSIVDEAQRLPFVVQHVVNNIQAVPAHYPLFEFWKTYGARFLEWREHAKVRPGADRVEAAAQSLLRVSRTLHERLKQTRDRLSIESGVPPAPPLAAGEESFWVPTYAQRTGPARPASVLREKSR